MQATERGNDAHVLHQTRVGVRGWEEFKNRIGRHEAGPLRPAARPGPILIPPITATRAALRTKQGPIVVEGGRDDRHRLRGVLPRQPVYAGEDHAPLVAGRWMKW